MSKIYIVAVNWEKMEEGTGTSYTWLREHDVEEGTDIAQWVESLPHSQNWRVYPYRTKRFRDLTVQNCMRKWAESCVK